MRGPRLWPACQPVEIGHVAVFQCADDHRLARGEVLVKCAKRHIGPSPQGLDPLLGEHQLTDSHGRRFSLADYRGKPLVISLIYTSCSTVCPITTQHLLDAVTEARRSLGADRFAVLTIGFDARNDTPPRMASFANRQGIPAQNWRAASGDAATLTALLRELGFSYLAAAGGGPISLDALFGRNDTIKG